MFLMPKPKQQYFSLAGIPLVGGKIYTYAANTSTPKATYTSSGALQPNPIPLNSRGEPTNAIFWDGAYRVEIRDVLGNLIYTVDNFNTPAMPNDLSSGASGFGAGLIGFLYASTYAAGTVGRWLKDLALGTGSTFIGFIHSGVGAIVETIQAVLREQWRFTSYNAKFDGVTDDTDAINRAILAAYKSAANVLSPFGEIYSITIKAPSGKDCKIAGKILLPSQVVLDFNGCRLIGIDGSAGAEAYDPFGQHMIESATYDSGTGTMVSNIAAPVSTLRLVSSGVKNVSFLNVNCCLNLVNFNEMCFTENITVSNVSSWMRLKNCFYSTHTRVTVRNSCKFAGANAIYMEGEAGHRHTFTNIYIAGASVGLRTTCSTSFGCTFKDGSFEGAYNAIDGGGVDGTGILFDTGYSEAWSITGNYIEAVRWGIKQTGGATCNSMDISSNEFNTTEYAVLATANGFRNSMWQANPTPDGAAGIRNIVDFQTSNGNDIHVQLSGKSGSEPTAFPSNFKLGNISTAMGTSVWTRISDGAAVAKSAPGLANQNSLNSFAYEGAQMLSVPNEPPFVTLTRAINTLTVQTLLVYDLANNLLFNFYGVTDTLNYKLIGRIGGNEVFWDFHDPIGCVLTVNNVGGYVQLVFTNLTAAIPTINVYGGVRHV